MKKRKRGKWDNLRRNKNLKLRRDYINTHYIDGMDSITGDKNIEGIRPMTPEEKDYLSNFYGEYVNASFSENPLMETSEENKQKIKELKDEYKRLERKVFKLDPIKDMQKRNPLALRMVDIKSEIVRLDLKKDSYHRNNARNRCLLNKGKAINTVEFRTWEDLDQDTISNNLEYYEEKTMTYDEKYKLFQKINQIYPNVFTFEDINKMNAELIYEILNINDS